MQVCLWDKALSSCYNGEEMKRRSSKCFICWDLHLWCWQQLQQRFRLKTAHNSCWTPRGISTATTTDLPLSSWTVQPGEGKALCAEAVHAAWEWMSFFPLRASLLPAPCSCSLGADLVDDAAHRNFEPCGHQEQGSLSCNACSLIAGSLSEKQRCGEQAVETHPCFLA